MRPPFNSFRPQARPQGQQQHHQQQQNNRYSNHHQKQQHNGYQNQVQPNQLGGMMNPHMMNNPMMGHMNNQIPMPIHPQFFNNMPQQQQQQLQQFGLQNHINQLLPSLLGNLQYAVANNNNFMGHSLPLAQQFYQPPHQSSPAFIPQPQLGSFNSPPVPASHQNHHSGPPGFPGPPGFSEPRPQGQSVEIVNNNNGSGFKGDDFRNKFTKQQNFKGPRQGFQRCQSHQGDNAKKKFGFNKDHRGKGNYNKMTTGFDGADVGNIAKEKKRSSYALIYTPKEVQQWREARRKNYPTKQVVEKNAKKNVSDSILDEEAKMRRQQLREVLAKQAELGIEVAEVPSHYLSNKDEQVTGDRRDNNGRKGRFQNNRHRRNRKPRFQDKNPSQETSMTMMTRKPTLLEKLLSADIKRDKSQLLQVFRFMVMNSFLQESPEQPLKLPLVTVEETGCEHVREDLITEVLCDGDDDDDDDDEEEEEEEEAVE
ncbi:unnamed protein product [Cochlearia groenlandica]